jgi:hypothetical protein
MTFLIGCFLFGYFRFPTAVLSRTLVLIINGVVRNLLPVFAGVFHAREVSRKDAKAAKREWLTHFVFKLAKVF